MKKKLTKKLSFSYCILLGAEVIYNLSAYIIAFGLARMLGPAGQGRYAVVIGVVTMFTIIIARGLPSAMMKRISENSTDNAHVAAVRKGTLKLQIPLVLTCTVLFFLACPLIANVLGDPSLTPLLRISALIIPFFSLSTFYVLYLNGLKSFRALAIIKSLRGLTRILSIIILAYLFSLEGAILGNIVAPLLLFIITIFLSTFIDPQTKKIAALGHVKAYPWRKITSYAGTFILYLFFYEFFIRVDLFLIKSTLGDDTITGLYDAAVKVILLPFYGIYALTLILFPTMSEMAKKGDIQTIRSILNKLGIIASIVLPLGALTLYFLRDLFIKVIFGTEFAPASDFIPYMLGATIFATIFYVLASVLNGAGYTKITASIIGIGLMMSIVLNLIFIPIYGAYATATIFSLSTATMGLLTLFFTYKKFYHTR